MKKVLVIDTSVLCVWLEVVGMNYCGPDKDRWDKNRVASKISDELRNKTTFVLPLATIIETGNHIAQSAHSRRAKADELAELMRKSAEAESPWAAFSEQGHLWSHAKLKSLAEAWPKLADQKLSLGDATIRDVATYYSEAGYHVEILTGDQGLKAYEPTAPAAIPRRRARR